MENHIVTEENNFNLDICTHLVRQYLLAQEWQLTDPADLAVVIYEELESQDLKEDTAVQAVQTQIWRRYAAILHDACCQSGEAAYEQAWQELGSWLRRQRQKLLWHIEEQEDVVQETLASLQIQLEKNILKAPRAFLMYALQTLRHTTVDLERKRTAVFRGGGHDPLSWEALNEAASERSIAAQSEPITRPGLPERRIENTVSDREVHAKLKTFFSQHLSSKQQVLVAELHFLDGLSPKEIAGLLGKQPHEIRMVKFRVVQTLRSLPAAEQQKLLAILGEQEKDETDES